MGRAACTGDAEAPWKGRSAAAGGAVGFWRSITEWGRKRNDQRNAFGNQLEVGPGTNDKSRLPIYKTTTTTTFDFSLN